MGQGLYVKVAQVVAEEFQIDIDKVRITATTTGKVPNTSATAASSGADLNGKAAQVAAHTIKERLIGFAVENWGVPREQVVFLPNRVRIGNQEIPFADLVRTAYMARIQLSSTGFYKTPEIHWDRAAGSGKPFYYFSYGAAAAEVTVDTFTGEYRVDRVDILHDVGKSLNPALDRGQVEGGFVQGMGWLTMEELWWDAARPSPHPCPQHLQDPGVQRPPEDLQRPPAGELAQPQGHDLPLQGGRRASPDARHVGAPRDLRRRRQRRGLPAVPPHRSSRHA